MPFSDIPTLPLSFQSLHPSARLPQYSTPGSAALDLTTVEFGTAPAHGSAVFATGLAVAVPEGHVMLLFSRSGHGFRYGVRLSNCVGVIDSDYRGEIMVSLANDSPTPFSFEPGDRIAQAIVLPVPYLLPVWAPLLPSTVRGSGGFGSTGA